MPQHLLLLAASLLVCYCEENTGTAFGSGALCQALCKHQVSWSPPFPLQQRMGTHPPALQGDKGQDSPTGSYLTQFFQGPQKVSEEFLPAS